MIIKSALDFCGDGDAVNYLTSTLHVGESTWTNRDACTCSVSVKSKGQRAKSLSRSPIRQ